LCKCSTIGYNLLSACDACQGQTWIPWTEYITNCSETMPPSTFPNPVPSGTRVPKWALMDDTSVNLWDAITAETVGDSPEALPGAVLGAATSSTSVAGAGHVTTTLGASTRVAGSPSSATSGVTGSSGKSSGSGSSNTAAIAGGAAGGVVGLAIIGALLFYFLKRRQPPKAPSAAFVADGSTATQPVAQMSQLAPPLPSDDGSTYAPGTPVTPVKLYNPNDPTTYPGYQSLPTTPDVPAHAAVSYEGSLNRNSLNASPPNGNPLNGNTLGNMQSTPNGNTFNGNTLGSMQSTPNGNAFNGNTLNGNTLGSMQTTHATGYHGLPTV